MSLLSVRDLTLCFDSGAAPVSALDRVAFGIAEAETYALLGESGCGKSLTALSLMRLLPPDAVISAGMVEFAGRELCALTEAEMRTVRGSAMAMIFQEPATSLNAVLTVGQQIGEVLALHRGLRGVEAKKETVALLELVGIPDAERRLDEYPFQFSGGMKQRVMIAMALAGEPELLIADEPTTALDVTIQAQVLDVLARLQRERRMSILLITHDLGVVARMAHRIGVMYAGELIEEAPRERFFAAPAHPYSRKLFRALPDENTGRLETIPGSVPPLGTRFDGCRFAARCEHAWQRCHEAPPAWYPHADSARVRCHLFDPEETACAQAPQSAVPTPRAQVAAGAPLLVTKALRVHFPIRAGFLRRTVGSVKAVDGVSLDIRAGRTLALVGESGCGKTTVGKAILRLIEPSGGEVRLAEHDLATLDGANLRRLRSRMQMIFQDPFGSLNPRMRVLDLIEEGMQSLDREGDATARRERALALLEQVGLRRDMAERYPHEFSGGQRQRIAIARALAVAPDLLVCDEPTSALDVSVQAQILNLLQQLQTDLGIAYLFITHNIGVVEYLAHDVAVMYLGRIVEKGPTHEVLRHPRHPYTQALLASVPRVRAVSGQARVAIGGEIPSPSNPPAGCHFHPRCPHATDACRTSYPTARRVGERHEVSCHLAEPIGVPA